MRKDLLVSLVIQVFSVGAALGWWTFNVPTVPFLALVCAAWVAVLVYRRRGLTRLDGLYVIALGVSLPFVWMLAAVASEVVLIFALTALVVGLVLLPLCPLILWG